MRDEMVTSISQITNLTIKTDVLLFGTNEVQIKLILQYLRQNIKIQSLQNDLLIDNTTLMLQFPGHWSIAKTNRGISTLLSV